MSLLIPLALLAAMAVCCWMAQFPSVRDVVIHAAGACALCFGMTALGVFGYGVYSWLRFGAFDNVPVARIVALVDPQSPLFRPIEWEGINRLSAWYLESSITWTLLASAMAFFYVAEWTWELEAKEPAKPTITLDQL